MYMIIIYIFCFRMSYFDVTISTLTNEELRNKLVSKGINVGPIGPSTRTIYEKKLLKLCSNVSNLYNNIHQVQEKIYDHDKIKLLSLSSQKNGAKIDYNASANNSFKNYQEVKFLIIFNFYMFF